MSMRRYWSDERQRWFYPRWQVYAKRVRLFLAIVWRDTGYGYRVPVDLAWKAARDVWGATNWNERLYTDRYCQ